MTPFHLPSIRSSVASTAQPGRWAKFRLFMGAFPIVSKQGLYPRIYSTCQKRARPTIRRRAFSSEWTPVRRQENASNRKIRVLVPIDQNQDSAIAPYIGDNEHEGHRIQEIPANRRG